MPQQYINLYRNVVSKLFNVEPFIVIHHTRFLTAIIPISPRRQRVVLHLKEEMTMLTEYITAIGSVLAGIAALGAWLTSLRTKNEVEGLKVQLQQLNISLGGQGGGGGINSGAGGGGGGGPGAPGGPGGSVYSGAEGARRG